MRTTSTIQMDFFDLISFRIYGSEFYMDQIIDVNPDQRLIVRFNAGQVLNVPEVEPMPVSGLAPWRRVVKIR